MSKRKIYYIIVCLLLAIIVSSVVYYSKDLPIWITHEVSATGTDPMTSTGMVSSSIKKIKLPYSFQAGKVNSLTVHSPRILTSVKPGIIIIGFTATQPVDFMAVASSEPVWGFSLYGSGMVDVLINVSEAYSYYTQIEFSENAVLSLCFKSNPKRLSAVTLSGYKTPPFTVFGGVDEEIDEAVNMARAFLRLNDVDVGKYLQYSVEQGVPNYYWHINLGIKHPLLPPTCEYIVIRFEQANRPGHYYEVWVNPETNQIIGGGACR